MNTRKLFTGKIDIDTMQYVYTEINETCTIWSSSMHEDVGVMFSIFYFLSFFFSFFFFFFFLIEDTQETIRRGTKKKVKNGTNSGRIRKPVS